MEALAPARRGELEGFETITLSAGALEASFAPALGMAGVSLRHGAEELLDRRAGLRAYARTGAVMGIPLLYPWANRLAAHEYTLAGRRVTLPPGPPLVHCEEHGLPIHGLLNASPHWRITTHESARVVARLDFASRPELLAAFPYPHVLELEAALSAERLRVTTTVSPTAQVAVPIAFGFHPYLRLPGVPREEWLVAFPARRHLALDERSIPTGAGQREPAKRFGLADRAFDDGYDSLADGAAFSIAGGGRTITVTFDAGCPAGQVFSPAGAPFICFEPMTAPTNALRSGAGLRWVRPGDAFSASFSIHVGRVWTVTPRPGRFAPRERDRTGESERRGRGGRARGAAAGR
jgi:aldose 1-epimerase